MQAILLKNGFKVLILFDMFCASEALFSFILFMEKSSIKRMSSLPYHLVPYMLVRCNTATIRFTEQS